MFSTSTSLYTKFRPILLVLIFASQTLLLAVPDSNPFLLGETPPHPVTVIAHRGARAYAPENTLIAVKKAIELGAHMVEVDVHLSKDGVPVVVHDDTLVARSDVVKKFPNRTSYYVYDFTLEEIKRLDAGSWFVERLHAPAKQQPSFLREMTPKERKKFISAQDMEYYQSGQVKIPTLEEVILLIKQHNCYLNVEIKNISQFYPQIAARVVETIRSQQAESLVVITSFDHYQVAKAKELAPEIAGGVLSIERIYDPGYYCAKVLQADTYHPSCLPGKDTIGFDSISYRNKQQLLLESFQSVQQHQVKINVWTENDPKRMLKMIRVGVNGIITDYPNRALELLAKIKNSKTAAANSKE